MKNITIKNILLLLATMFILLTVSCATDPTEGNDDDDSSSSSAVTMPTVIDSTYFSTVTTNVSYAAPVQPGDAAILEKIPSDAKYLVFVRMSNLINDPTYQRVYNSIMTNYAPDIHSDSTNLQNDLGISFEDTAGAHVATLVFAGNAAITAEVDVGPDTRYTNDDPWAVWLQIPEGDPRYTEVEQAYWNGSDGIWQNSDWSWTNAYSVGPDWVYFYGDGFQSTNMERRIYEVDKAYFYADGRVGYGSPAETNVTNYMQQGGDMYLAANGVLPANIDENLTNASFSNLSTYGGADIYNEDGSVDAITIGVDTAVNHLYGAFNQTTVEKIIDTVSNTSVMSVPEMVASIEAYSTATIAGVAEITLEQLMRSSLWATFPASLKTEVDKYNVYVAFGIGFSSEFTISMSFILREQLTPANELISVNIQMMGDFNLLLDNLDDFFGNQAIEDFWANPNTGQPNP